VTRRAAPLALATLLSTLAGCGPQFDLSLPERFVVLAEDDRGRRAHYEMRATTPDGVVVGVKALEHRVEGSLAFWTEAVTRRLRDQRGYELLSEEDVRSASGVEGHLMRFGRDLGGHSYRYTMAVFVTESRIWIVEAGGREEPFSALEADVERSIAAMRM